MASEQMYTQTFVDILIEFMQCLSLDTVDRIYHAAYLEDVSGIREFRDFVYQNVERFEKFLKDHGDIQPDDFISRVTIFADLVQCSVKRSRSARNHVFTDAEITGHFKKCYVTKKRNGRTCGCLELRYNMRRKDKKCSTK